MKTKKIFSSVMALGLAMTLASCGGGDDKPADSKSTEDNGSAVTEDNTSTAAETTEGGDTAEDFEAVTDDNTLVIGVDSLNGDFIQGYRNDAHDVKAREFMGIEGSLGYGTYIRNRDGVYIWNPVALKEEPKSVKNDDGSETTTFKLAEDLVFSDGSKITADDYVMGALFESYPNYATVTGSSNIGADTLKGYNDFKEGKTDRFAGVKKIDDYTFETTVDKSFLPYYDADALKATGPLPSAYICPNLTVDSNDEGSKIVVKEGYEVTDEDKDNYIKAMDTQIENEKQNIEDEKEYAKEEEVSVDQDAISEYEENIKNLEDKKAKAESGDFDPTQLLLEQAWLFYDNDYRFNPAVTEGPYKFVSYKNNMAKMTINDKYKGDFEGKKPTIPNVIIQVVNPKIGVELLSNGDIDIWEDEADGGRIDQMKKAADEGKIGGFETYDRDGYGSLKFICDRGPTQYKEVRQAIAFLMDRNDFVQNFAGGYAVVTNGMYGSSQWMYKERGADVEAKLTNYTLNIDEANKRLDASPYKFEKDGKTPFDPAKAQEAYQKDSANFDYWRYDKDGKQLQVNQFGSTDSEITTLLNNQLPDNAKQAGMEYNVQAGDFGTLMTKLKYPEENPDYTAFNMGLGFGTPFDPWYQYSSEGNDNDSRVNDPECDRITQELRTTDPDDKEGYLDKWEEFQLWYNDYLPEIPLYSNQYHSGYSTRVEGYTGVTPTWSASQQIDSMSLK